MRRLLLFVSRLALVACLGLVVVVLALWVRHSRPVELPAPTGPFAVGRVEYGWVDHLRRETLGGQPGDDRELMAWVWYPSTPSGATPAPYLPPRWLAARQGDRSIFAPLTQDLGTVRAHAVADVALAPSGQPYPVILLLPGLGPIAGDYTTIAEELASHGYVVVGVTPPYSASVVAFPDGRVTSGTAAGGVPDDASPEEASAPFLNGGID